MTTAMFKTPTLCKYPDCRAVARNTWAFVPLCPGHHQTIRFETMNYYANRFGYSHRQHYHQIEPLVKEAWQSYAEYVKRQRGKGGEES
ncbi:hypothetical protein [Paenibacillus planticolens]|uniref:Uncharacterized protein n=1 Tax=Paenibacillus planticolens TaxID=2654976 RepID=A0ABX2A169_9BACL|nr:hypothetical protein [Paenibacillus planticolens]NOV04743.1 hypothetical protein [Paenibacillus planticolens]